MHKQEEDYFTAHRSDNAGSEMNIAAEEMKVIDVVLYGLNLIIPMISQQMMKVCACMMFTRVAIATVNEHPQPS